MPTVDRNILRAAIYENSHTTTFRLVAVNEAVELAKSMEIGIPSGL